MRIAIPLPLHVHSRSLVVLPLCVVAIFISLAAPARAQAQVRPYIGFAYPAGAQQGATVNIRLGGQGLDGVHSIRVTGSGVTAKITDFYRRLNNQEMQLLNEQISSLRRQTMSASSKAALKVAEQTDMMADNQMEPMAAKEENAEAEKEAARDMIQKIEKRTLEFVQNPACAAIASLVLVDITVAPDAEPGEREIRVITERGVSNPLPFHVGQVPEVSKKPMKTAVQQVLGKESQALRKRPANEAEETITPPCTVNGQIASAEVNRYRFTAAKGQRLVITTLGRQLVPFIADAVPGWFQPVLALYDANGKEVAYSDDYTFKPDPTIFYEVPQDGEYVFTIRDSLYRGREDFVYRITIGQLPVVTSIFPLGGPSDAPAKPQLKGWNLQELEPEPVPRGTQPGIHLLTAESKTKGLVSNPFPYAVDKLPECLEKEPNNEPSKAQAVTLPIIINGRIDRPDDIDVFAFTGKAGEHVIAEVMARRLDSPLDSVIKLTDQSGKLIAFNDDHEDLAAGLNTHHADSYFSVRLPADGTYYLHLADTARQGGETYGYRLRLSAPQPDFELRVVPSSLSLRIRTSGALTVYAMRKDGFAGPIKLGLRAPPNGLSAAPITISSTQTIAKLSIRAGATSRRQPVNVTVVGKAMIGDKEVEHVAVPAEDRMQAFLWRHLVPAKDLPVLVFDPDYRPEPKRVPPERPAPVASTPPATATNVVASTNTTGTASNAVANRPRFTKQQVAGRLRQLRLLYEEDMLTDDFYAQKVAECEAVQ